MINLAITFFQEIKLIALSAYQKPFVEFWKSNPSSSIHNVSLVFHLKGKLNKIFLKKTCEYLIGFHEIFNICLHADNKHLIIKNYDINQFYFESTYHNKYIDTHLRSIVNKTFSLTNEPLGQFHLLTDEACSTESYFLIVAHHIISDAHFGKIVQDHISTIYNLLLAGKNIHRDKLFSQNKGLNEFINEEHRLLNVDLKREAYEFWITELKDFPLHTSLPISPLNTLITKDKGEFIYFHIDHLLTAQLNFLTQCNKTTLFTLFIALFALVLAKVSGQNKLLIRYIINARMKKFSMVGGSFINHLIYTFDFGQNEVLDKILMDLFIQKNKLERIKYVPTFEVIQEIAKKTSTLNPLNVSFTQTYLNSLGLQLDKVQTQPVLIPWSQNVASDFGMQYDASNDTIVFRLHYRASILTADFANSFIQRFKHGLQHICSHPFNEIHRDDF